MKCRISAVGLGCPFEVGFDKAEELLNSTVEVLRTSGADVYNAEVVMYDLKSVEAAASRLTSVQTDVLLICIATWSEDHHLLDLLSYIDKPVILRAYPARDTGSLCCAHQIGAVFTDIGKGYDFVYGEADDIKCAEKVIETATAHALSNCMSKVRIGTIGGRVKGMTEIAYDEFSIKQKLGARVVNIDEKEMTSIVNDMSDDEAEKVLSEKESMLGRFKRISDKPAMLESIKYYCAMKKLIEEYDLSAIAVKCYTTYMGKICLGYSILAEEGIMGSCEGDVTNGLAMKIMYELSGRPVNNTDLLYLDDDKNTILFAHCGSSGFSIAGGEVELAPVRLAETGVCARFVMAPGKVTAVNICGHGNQFRLSVMVGDALPCGMEFPGNPTVVRFGRPVSDINEDIMANGIGHHWMIGYGDFSKILRSFCQINKIKFYQL